jgi:hypothetical protein
MRFAYSILVAVFLSSISSSGIAAVSVDKLNKASSFVTTGGEDFRFKRTPQKTFSIADRLFLLTMVTWEPVDKGAGRHKVAWKWYSKDRLVSEITQKHNFKPTPFEFWATIPASALGVGEHKVELLIDDKLFDAQAFTVTEQPTAPATDGAK